MDSEGLGNEVSSQLCNRYDYCRCYLLAAFIMPWIVQGNCHGQKCWLFNMCGGFPEMEQYFEGRHSAFEPFATPTPCPNIEVNWGSLRSQITTTNKEFNILVWLFSVQDLVKIPLEVYSELLLITLKSWTCFIIWQPGYPVHCKLSV